MLSLGVSVQELRVLVHRLARVIWRVRRTLKIMRRLVLLLGPYYLRAMHHQPMGGLWGA